MKYLLSFILSFYCLSIQAQLGLFINGSDASLRVDSTSYLSVDGDFYNLNCDPLAYVKFNGALYLTGSLINNDSLRFSATTGSGNSKKARIIFKPSTLTTTNTAGAIIGGTVSPVFWEVEFDKSIGGQISLHNNVKCLDTVTFITGHIYMNGYKWKMLDPVGTPAVINHPYFKNEKHSCQFQAASINDTGLVIYKTIYTNSSSINPANIGIEFAGPLDIGSPLTIYRGFKQQVNAVKSSILKYYDVYSPNHSLLGNLLKIRYSHTEVNFISTGYLNTSSLSVYASPNTDMNWSHLPSVAQHTMIIVNSPTLNGEFSADLSDLSLPNTSIAGEAFRITIADAACPNPPLSSFTSDTLHLCTGSTVVLDAGNNSSISNTSLKWEWFSNPAIYTQTILVSPNTTYQKFKVKLQDVRGCVNFDSVIVAPQAPYPQITYLNHLNACAGDSIMIKDTVKISSGTYSNHWIFSDGDSSFTLQKTFKKKFQSTGTHALQLIVSSNYGCTVTATSTNVIVYPSPTASYTSNYNCNNSMMNFTNTSVANHSAMAITGSYWNLGLGASNTSTLFSPSQNYSVSGTYSVKLLSTTSFGCKDSILSTIQIYPRNQALFTKNNACLTDTVYLNNLSVCNTGSCSYQWLFSDASTSSQLSTKKVFAAPGLYTVKLKVTNTLGCPDSTSSSVFINPRPNAQVLVTNSITCLNNYIYLTNNSTISSGAISNYNWNFGNTASSTSTNGVTNYSVAGLYITTLTAVSDSSCISETTVALLVKAQPVSQYTVNSVCKGNPSQFVSTSVGTGLSYIWNYGNSVISSSLSSSSQNYSYASAGNYSTSLIAIDSWGCSDTSSVVASVLTSPSLALSGTLSTCGSSYTLDAGNPGSSYLWSPGNQTSQTAIVSSSGNYQVTITNTNACISNQSVQLILNSIVKPHLGNDTTHCGSLVLNAGYPGSSYLWNNGATSQTMQANTSGTYIVQVIDLNGCLGEDTVLLNIFSPTQISLGNDLSICKPKYGQEIIAVSNATNFVWNNGSTGSSIVLNNSGTYWCEATAANGCVKRDSITINFLSTPSLDLGSDKSSCSAISLDAQNYGCQYFWSNSSHQQIISATQSGIYFVTVTNTLSGCSQNDSIQLKIYTPPIVALGNDTSVCNNIQFTLKAENPGSIYLWSTGETSQNIIVGSSGIYGVTVIDSNSCSASDYIDIIMMPAPSVELGNSLRYLCTNTTIHLEVPNSGGIEWHSDKGINSVSNSIDISQEGKYWVCVNEFGCSASDTVLVISTNNTIQASFLASTRDTINTAVKFVNLTDPVPLSQYWDFGDGTSSTEFSPEKTYVLPKNYNVTLEVSNGYCTDRLTKDLEALFRERPHENKFYSTLELIHFLCYPNPLIEKLKFELELSAASKISVQVSDLLGKQILTENYSNKNALSSELDFTQLSNGIYFLSIIAENNKGNINKTVKLIKTN